MLGGLFLGVATMEALLHALSLLSRPWNGDIWGALLNPEILIGTGSYLLLKPILRRSGLVDTTKVHSRAKSSHKITHARWA